MISMKNRSIRELVEVSIPSHFTLKLKEVKISPVYFSIHQAELSVVAIMLIMCRQVILKNQIDESIYSTQAIEHVLITTSASYLFRDGGCVMPCEQVFIYHRAFPMPALSYKFSSVDPLSGNETDDSAQFISSVCWRGHSSMLVAANSTGDIKLMEMV